MDKQITITIIGIGAVGGYYGGLLARFYENNPMVRIAFVCRGENFSRIKTHGLTVKQKEEEFVVNPDIVTDNPKDIGASDYVIVATKAYDLEQSMRQYASLITKDTVVLPLLNGVLPFEQLKQIFSDASVVQGCTYIVSRLTEPARVENPSARQRIVVGNDKHSTALAELLDPAGIQVSVVGDISSEIWKKYLLVSTSALATAYYNSSFGEICTRYKNELISLLEDASAVAVGLGIALPQDIVAQTFDKIQAVPGESTTSMHSDFINKKHVNELDLFGGYIIDKAACLAIEVPTYQRMYDLLKNKDPQQYPFKGSRTKVGEEIVK